MARPIVEGFKQVSSAAGEALRGIRRASGLTTDPELIRYSSFKAPDFEALSEQYGEDNVLEYIREMETKRLMENR